MLFIYFPLEDVFQQLIVLLHIPGVLGLELRDKVFFGVPGGVLGGVTPLPFTRLSPGKKSQNDDKEKL